MKGALAASGKDNGAHEEDEQKPGLSATCSSMSPCLLICEMGTIIPRGKVVRMQQMTCF